MLHDTLSTSSSKDFLVKIRKKERVSESGGRGGSCCRYRMSPYSGKCDSIFTFSAAFLGAEAGMGYSLSFPQHLHNKLFHEEWSLVVIVATGNGFLSSQEA